jgi:signal transduction histidine kinase/CheY-like chemotaxis protein
MQEPSRQSVRSFSGRLSTAVWLTVLFCFLAGTILVSSVFYLSSIRQIEREYISAAEFIAAVCAPIMKSGQYSDIYLAVSTFVKNRNIASVTIRDARDSVISAYSTSTKHISPVQTLSIHRPIIAADGTRLGTVDLDISLTGFHVRLFHSFGLIAILILFPAFAAVFIIRRKIRKLISEPLAQLLKSAQDLSPGSASRRIVIPADIEISSLALEFNRIMEDLKREQERRETSQKVETIGKLAGGIAHDFNNILGGIIGNISLLRYKIRSGTISDEEIEGYLHSVEVISQKAVSLSKQLLSLSKSRESATNPVNLADVINNVVRICRKTLDRRIEVTARSLPENAITSGDPGQIEQAVLNVCINAAHAMTIMRSAEETQGGKLVLGLYGPVFPTSETEQFSCSREHPYWAVTVKDEGVGMDEGAITRIYDPFFTTKEGQGTGLGMTMVYSIINRHAGFVLIESEKGKGTSVTLHLPEHKTEKETAVTTPKKTAIAKENRGLVLLVDDEDYIRKMATSILTFGGYQTITAAGGNDAVNVYIDRRSDISLIVLDLIMPGKSGLETYNEIRSINPSAQVLFTSGLYSLEGETIIELPDTAAFLPKPYTAEQLLRIVDRLVNSGKKTVL